MFYICTNSQISNNDKYEKQGADVRYYTSLFNFVSPVMAQDDITFNPIQTAVPFLTIAPDSRAGALGDAGVATSPDLFSMHWNPAKFAFIDGNGGFVSPIPPWLRALIPDINLSYLTGYYRIDSRQVVAGSLMYSSLGKLNSRMSPASLF